MSFVNAGLLTAGLIAVAVPILIHILLRRRRKPVAFAAMRFLLEAYKQRRARTRLEQLILLLLRCLVVLLVAIALGRPLLGGGGLAGQRPTELVLLLDNSLTASAQIEPGDEEPTTELDLLKDEALAALATLDPSRGDRAALVLLGSPAEPIIWPATTDLAAVRRRIESAGATDGLADLHGAAALLTQLDEPKAVDRRAVVLSGYRAGSVALDRPLPALDEQTAFVSIQPAAAPRPNVWIESLRAGRRVVVPGSPLAAAQQLAVTLARDEASARTEATTRVSFTWRSSGNQSTPTKRETTTAQARWSPGQTEITISAPVPPVAGSARDDSDLDLGPAGIALLDASIASHSGPDAIKRDGLRAAAIERRESIRVGVVARARFGARVGITEFRPADWARAALAPSATTRGDGRDTGGIQPIDLDPGSLDPGRVAGLDAAVVLRPDLVTPAGWRQLAAIPRRGGVLIVAPPAEDAANLWPDRLAEALAGITDSFITASRDPVELSPGERLAAGPVPTTGDPLGLLRGELDALAGAVTAARLLEIQPGDASVLLQTESGRPLLTHLTPSSGDGAVVVFASAVDPAWTDLPAKPLFVPLIQELVRQGIGPGRRVVGFEAGANAPVIDAAVELADPRTGEARRAASPTEAVPVRRAGTLVARGDNGAALALLIAAPSAGASDTSPTPADQVAAWLAPLAGGEPPEFAPSGEVAGHLRAEGERGRPFDWPLLALALACAAAELILARYASHAFRRGTAQFAAEDRHAMQDWRRDHAGPTEEPAR